MKNLLTKLLMMLLLVVLATVALGASLVVGVRARGGLSPERAGLRKLPVVGGMLPLKQPQEDKTTEETTGSSTTEQETETDEEAGDLPEPRDSKSVQELVSLLERKRRDLRRKTRELENRRKETKAWEQQLARQQSELEKSFEEKKAELEALQKKLKTQKAELEDHRIRLAGRKRENLRKTASVFESMDPEKAAEILEKMYADGKQDEVVSIIYFMRERRAAKALAAFVDPSISAQITQKLSRIDDESNEEG
jgi:flagellar motility protein MotE (MotC chaperone)